MADACWLRCFKLCSDRLTSRSSIERTADYFRSDAASRRRTTTQGIAIGGRRYLGHEILAPAEGVVVRIRGDHVTIHHGLDSKRQDTYTEHFHVHEPPAKEGDQVKRGQNIGLIGRGKYTALPHYHYVVRKREGPPYQY